jgi:hypothetical protein
VLGRTNRSQMANLIITLSSFLLAPSVAAGQGTVSDSVQRAELQVILRPVVKSAKSFLLNRKNFHPFAAALSQDRKLILVDTYDSKARKSFEMLDWLKHALQQGAKDGEYRASAVAFECVVNIPGSGKKSDAFAVVLDHSGGTHFTMYYPYSVTKEGKFDFQEPFEGQGTYHIFPVSD